MLLAQRADISQSLPNANMSMVIQDYRHAIQGSQCSLWGTMIAELHVKLGMALQSSAGSNRGALLEAIQAYQHALQHGVDESRHPELFATLQNNLGLAYLAMPQVESSAQLRVGIAVQSFRHALAIFTKETDQDRWASTCMNLANALQYAPTSHPQENLIQAVDLYEDVLSVRTRAKDPVAYALVLLNQANALAHLGIFKPSLEKLSEAYKLFQWYEQTEQAMAARELVDQINHRIAEHHQRDTEPVSHT
jgi:tetratricopeptide (TPR) repeat protein